MNARAKAAAIIAFAVLTAAEAFSQSWPEVRGPLSLADNLLNSSVISKSPGGLYDLRRKTAELFTPTFSIVSYDASSLPTMTLDREFFSYSLGSALYEDASALLFAKDLYAPSDTLDYLRGLLCYDIHDFRRAEENFSRIPQTSPYRPQADSFLEVWTSTPAIPNYKKKSPVLAAAMSAVIPGAGKVYAGDLRSGVSTFIIVGALGAIVAESAHKLGWNDWRTISLSSVLGLFYIGNIYGSAITVSVVKNTYQDAQKATLLFGLHTSLHQF